MAKPIANLLVLTILAVCGHLEVAAQNALSRNGVDLEFTVFETSNNNLTIEDVLQNRYDFNDPDSYVDERAHPKHIYWIKIDLISELDRLRKDSTWLLAPEYFDYGTLYQRDSTSILKTKFGWFENSSKEGSILYGEEVPFKSTGLINDKYIYLKVRSVADLEKISDWKISYGPQSKDGLAKNYSDVDLKYIVPAFLFTGICIIMFLMMLMFFVYSKRLEFLFYCSYVLCLFLYLGPYASRLYVMFLPSFNLLSYTFFQQMQMLINLSYVLFVMYYLNTKNLYPRLHAIIKKIAWMLVAVVILDVAFLSNKYFLGHIHLLHFQRLFMTVFGLGAMIYLLIKRKNNLACFIVGGSFCYMIGALGFLFFQNSYYMMAGSSLDILIFATGLTYKIQNEYKERLQFQQEAHMNKTKALRAQINPHFIFNSLNSIQNLIVKNDKKSALRYLSRFSRLTRNVLESSIETKVMLADEVKMLNDYLELESLRFDNAFDYTVVLDESIEPEITEFPSMIVQPFVENAILHGLLPKQGNEKILSLSFRDKGDYVLCEIDDNGIGREAAQKKSVQKNKKSRGMQVTLQRFKTLMGEEYENMIQIVDKKDSRQKAIGTKICIKIPI